MPENTQLPLSGQVAIVTGAARGIGEAIARRLAAMGATTVLLARDAASLDAVKTAIEAPGGIAIALPLDLRDTGAIEEQGRKLRDRLGRCDILVNNAGIGGIGKPLYQMAPEEWDAVMETNLRAPYLMIRAFAPLMIEAQRGHIINVSSLAGHNPLPNGAAYSASKWGLNGLTYSVAEELRSHGVRVSVIAPGSVNTHFGGGSGGKDPATKVQPADIAEIVALLVTQPAQSFISEVLVRPAKK